MSGAMTNLFAIVRTYESAAHVQRSVIGTGIAVANFFFCAYFERHVAGPVWQQGLVTLLAIETGLLVLVAMGVYLQVIDPILRRTRIHPVRPSTRFAFIVVALLRHRYTMMLWGSAVFSMTLMLHPSPAAVPFLILSFLLLGAAFVIASVTLLVVMERWTASGSVALAGLGVIACIMGSLAIVFPESRAIELLVPLKWCTSACDAALAGEFGAGLARLLPFPLLAGIGWLGGRRYA